MLLSLFLPTAKASLPLPSSKPSLESAPRALFSQKLWSKVLVRLEKGQIQPPSSLEDVDCGQLWLFTFKACLFSSSHPFIPPGPRPSPSSLICQRFDLQMLSDVHTPSPRMVPLPSSAGLFWALGALPKLPVSIWVFLLVHLA